MPYDAGKRLPAEHASRLGHLDVLKSPLVTQLCERFEKHIIDLPSTSPAWEPLTNSGEPLSVVFGTDGSFQVIRSDTPPYMELAFVKTAMIMIDHSALAQIDHDAPHPFALRDILSQSAQYHSTVFPLRHIRIANMNTSDTIRQIIYESFRDDSLECEPFETLKWLVYEKWNKHQKSLTPFYCPHCGEQVATLPYNADEGICPNTSCNGKIFVTDFLGFHQDMTAETAPDSVATAYMTLHETILLFTGIRYFWENQRDALARCLFVKDGPLALYSQYSKLVEPIRRFLAFASAHGQSIYLIGQEKTGKFAEHLELIQRQAPSRSLFIPDNHYISEQIQYRSEKKKSYGEDTYYGAKVFVKLNDYHSMILNIPTGDYKANPKFADLIGAERIFATLPHILSNRYEGALLPIELAHSVASLSTYPSAPIFKMFIENLRRPQ